ncbi:MAG: hypothetical protein KFF68_01900, partial [Desulfosarcina sp.]|nr:hypothetical protein [Desulfosarcina sp.]
TPEDWKIEAAERLVGYSRTADIALVGVVFITVIGLIAFARRTVSAGFRARQGSEGIILRLMAFCAIFAIFITIAIVFALVYETSKFFSMVPITEFLFGLNWEPQIPIREDQIAIILTAHRRL